MFNVRAAARQARLRFVPRQPKPPRKEHQQNSRSSLPFSFSPCSLIKSTKTVSEMLAQRVLAVCRQSFRNRGILGLTLLGLPYTLCFRCFLALRTSCAVSVVVHWCLLAPGG